MDLTSGHLEERIEREGGRRDRHQWRRPDLARAGGLGVSRDLYDLPAAIPICDDAERCAIRGRDDNRAHLLDRHPTRDIGDGCVRPARHRRPPDQLLHASVEE
jgi:hypothetical protein